MTAWSCLSSAAGQFSPARRTLTERLAGRLKRGRSKTPLLLAALAGLSAQVSCKTVHVEEGLFFKPRPCDQATSVSGEVAYEDVRVTVGDTVRIQTLLAAPLESRALLLYFGGNEVRHCPGQGGLAETMRNRMNGWAAERAMSVAYVNYRGYGASGGIPSLEAGSRDALAVYDALHADARFADLPVVVYGQSLGAAFAIALATERPVAGLVLESPPTTAKEVLANATPWYLEPFVRYRLAATLERQDNAVSVRDVAVPLLVLVGSKDRLTPPRMAARVADSSRAMDRSLVVVPGGGHGNLAQRDEFWAALSTFVDRAAQP